MLVPTVSEKMRVGRASTRSNPDTQPKRVAEKAGAVRKYPHEVGHALASSREGSF